MVSGERSEGARSESGASAEGGCPYGAWARIVSLAAKGVFFALLVADPASVRAGTTCIAAEVSREGAPAVRSGHVALWLGDRMLVWGGSGASGFLDDGGLYFPAADRWQGLALAEGPSAREYASAVWTGAVVLIWGGEGPNGPMGDGANLRRDGSLADPLPRLGAPSPRVFHTAIWTGTAMVVWGGQDRARRARGDGALYDPRSKQWRTLPSEGAPTARYNHSATWTGTEMVVWGGHGDTLNPIAGGAAFSVADWRWRTLDGDGSRSPGTSHHQAIWTGDSVLISGGMLASGEASSTVVRLRTGGGAVALARAEVVAAARYNHAAVWTPLGLLVWGGKTLAGLGAPAASDGLLFDESGMRAAPVAVHGLRPGRSEHTLLWTGSEAIVWGGYSNLPPDTLVPGGVRLRIEMEPLRPNIDPDMPIECRWAPRVQSGRGAG